MRQPATLLLRAVSAAGAVLLLGQASFAVARQPGQVVPESPPYVEGIDVSHWQGTPAWRQVRASGVGFVIAKASEGETLTDPQYGRNKRKADALGLPFTAYHFARPTSAANDAVVQADNFVTAAGLRGRHLVPVLDLEDAGTLSVRQLRDWVRTWLARVASRLGVRATIYTSPMFWHDQMGDSTWFAAHGYRLWIANWNVTQPTVPAANWGGLGWTFWQYSDCGSVPGITGCVDLDRYGGTDLSSLTIAANR